MSARLFRPFLALLVPLLIATPAHAEHPQTDGGALGDASSDCEGNVPEILLGHATHGRLDPPQDIADSYLFHVQGTDVGRAHSLLLAGFFPETLRVSVLAPAFPGGPRCAWELVSGQAGEPLTFTPSVPGEHVVLVQDWDGKPLLDLPHASPPVAPITFCHNMCEPVLRELGFTILLDIP